MEIQDEVGRKLAVKRLPEGAAGIARLHELFAAHLGEDGDPSTSMNRSLERLVYFSDAVVAIALTLLVLPLAEAVPEAVSKHADSLKVITENQWKIYSFLLSFAVIARLWVWHHRLFEQIKAYSYPLMVWRYWCPESVSSRSCRSG